MDHLTIRDLRSGVLPVLPVPPWSQMPIVMHLKMNSPPQFPIAFHPKMSALAITNSSNMTSRTFKSSFLPRLSRTIAKSSSPVVTDQLGGNDDEASEVEIGKDEIVGEEKAISLEMIDIAIEDETKFLDNDIKRKLASQIMKSINETLVKFAKSGGGEAKTIGICARVHFVKLDEENQDSKIYTENLDEEKQQNGTVEEELDAETIHEMKLKTDFIENVMRDVMAEMKRSEGVIRNIVEEAKNDNIAFKQIAETKLRNTEQNEISSKNATSEEENRKKELEKQDKITQEFYAKLIKKIEKEEWYKLIYQSLIASKAYVIVIIIFSGLMLHMKVINAISPSYMPQMAVEIFEWLGKSMIGIIFMANRNAIELDVKLKLNESLKHVSQILEEGEGEEKFHGPEEGKVEEPEEAKFDEEQIDRD